MNLLDINVCSTKDFSVMKLLLTLLACGFLLGGLTSCYTARGLGEDISTLGNRISSDAQEHMDD
jgi:predicted small secreted protein